MRIKVDYELCQGNGLCIDAAPELFHMYDEDDQVRVSHESPPEDLYEKAKEAKRLCPTLAITLAD